MVKIVGFRHLDFVDQSGKKIVGDRIYVSDDSNSSVTGVMTDSIFVPDGRISFKLAVNLPIDIRYNKYGKIQTVELIGKEKY